MFFFNEFVPSGNTVSVTAKRETGMGKFDWRATDERQVNL